MKKISLLLLLFVFAACKHKKNTEHAVVETRTSGTLKLLVDETFAPIVDKQIEIFKLDYPDATITQRLDNERKILPTFLNDTIRVMVSSRVLNASEEEYYAKRSIKVNTSRFAVDGIALIVNADNIDSTITVDEVVDVLKGKSTNKNLVFDNAYSSTLRYFKDLAQINSLPKSGVYTLKTNNDVIKYIAENKNYIGVIGINWLSDDNTEAKNYLSKVKLLGVKNIKGKKGDDAFYKPIQINLIKGIYPLLRNLYIINAEGRDGLGTGFANWLLSQRGQLIVLKSGLGPHKMMPREINLIKENKN